jgi:hypothetical protein
MQKELSATHGEALQLLAVNGAGFESGAAEMAALGALPLLQDTATENVWARWAVTYRDVVILDRENRAVAVYNLTEHDLSVPANYDALKALLEQALR